MKIIFRKKGAKDKSKEQGDGETDIAALIEALPETMTDSDIEPIDADQLAGDVRIELEDSTSDWENQYWNAIVVPEYPDRACKTGFTGALYRNACKGGIDAYDAYAKNNGPLEYGTVVLTPAGKGRHMHYIHVVCLGAGKEHDFKVVKECVKNALLLVQDHSDAFDRIVFPALNVDSLGTLTPEQSAKAILSGIEENFRNNEKIQHPIHINLYNLFTYEKFQNVWYKKTFHNADENQPGEHDPAHGCCLLVERPKHPVIANGKNGDEPKPL